MSVNPTGFTVRGRREGRGFWLGAQRAKVRPGISTRDAPRGRVSKAVWWQSSWHLGPSTSPMGRVDTVGWGRDGQKGSHWDPSHFVPAQHFGVTQLSYPAGRTLKKMPDPLGAQAPQSLLSHLIGNCPDSQAPPFRTQHPLCGVLRVGGGITIQNREEPIFTL